MVVRNVSQRRNLFERVVSRASGISDQFFIVDHGSTDDSLDIIKSLEKSHKLDLEIKKEIFEGTMDEMKGKYYLYLQRKYGSENTYIFILDWDELLDEKLVVEINQLPTQHDVYLINRNTYLIDRVIDRNSYLPLLFKINSVEIFPAETFHKLYNIKSKDQQKLQAPLHHYSYESMNDLAKKNIFYARKEAQVLFHSNSNISDISLIVRYLYEANVYFLYTLFYHINFINIEGWLYSINWYIYKYYKYLFYLEMKSKSAK